MRKGEPGVTHANDVGGNDGDGTDGEDAKASEGREGCGDEEGHTVGEQTTVLAASTAS